MTLVRANNDFEITEKSLEDDAEIKDAIFYDVPIAFIEAFVLKNPGDFCISKPSNGVFHLSIVASSNKAKNEAPRVVHLCIDSLEKELGIQGMLFARAKTLGRLIYQLKNDNIDVLGGVLDENLSMRRLLGPSETTKYNIYLKGDHVKEKKLQYQNYFIMVYTAEMTFADGKVKEALFEEHRSSEAFISEHKSFYEKIVIGRELSTKNLPIRLPIGAILKPMTLIYELRKNEIGCSLEEFLKKFHTQLDLTQRVKICSSAVRILSEIHHSDIYHGASTMDNFYAEFVGSTNDKISNYELVFNGASGLLFEGKSDNSVSLVDYDFHAPEVAFTRKLTKESGVFNLGRLFEQILKPDLLKLYKEPAEAEPRILNEMRNVISRATRPNPSQRPTMHGIVLMIREILMDLPLSSTPINVVHYDQFFKKVNSKSNANER